jgi:hypothetical protein
VQSLQDFREVCDPVKLLKLERATAQLWKPTMNPEEKLAVELAMGEMLEESLYANYFLTFLHCKLTSTNSNQLKLEHEGFVFLKDKFLKMLSSKLFVPSQKSTPMISGCLWQDL